MVRSEDTSKRLNSASHDQLNKGGRVIPTKEKIKLIDEELLRRFKSDKKLRVKYLKKVKADIKKFEKEVYEIKRLLAYKEAVQKTLIHLKNLKKKIESL